jgi:hypothetical protein
VFKLVLGRFEVEDKEVIGFIDNLQKPELIKRGYVL